MCQLSGSIQRRTSQSKRTLSSCVPRSAATNSGSSTAEKSRGTVVIVSNTTRQLVGTAGPAQQFGEIRELTVEHLRRGSQLPPIDHPPQPGDRDPVAAADIDRQVVAGDRRLRLAHVLQRAQQRLLL